MSKTPNGPAWIVRLPNKCYLGFHHNCWCWVDRKEEAFSFYKRSDAIDVADEAGVGASVLRTPKVKE